ncbi:MAG TPA: hypothetical protein VGS22_14300 [Thermoanaerobaculia bacterium]|jgi:hypothetical protein|nr:hypothetical protein [Thermoanaerobaculia bacterium]
MKRKLKLHRDTVRNLEVIDDVHGGAATTTRQTVQVSLCVRCSLFGSCLPQCTLSPTACVPAACF